MSEETVESSRRVWDLFMAGDIPGVLAFLDPAIEVHDAPELPDASVYHGPEGWLAQIEKFRDVAEEITYRPLEFIDCGDKVVDVIEAESAGRMSGVSGTWTYAQVDTWRDGKVVRIQYFSSREAALDAAGSPG